MNDTTEYHEPRMRVLRIVQDCEAICEDTIAVILARPDVQPRRTQLQLLRDCADICTLTAKYFARNSTFSRHMAHLCAIVCEVCRNECLRHSDPESQHCGRVCLECARECRAFAGHPGYPGPGSGDMFGVYSEPEKKD